jgi:hypothetical protein
MWLFCFQPCCPMPNSPIVVLHLSPLRTVSREIICNFFDDFANSVNILILTSVKILSFGAKYDVLLHNRKRGLESLRT